MSLTEDAHWMKSARESESTLEFAVTSATGTLKASQRPRINPTIPQALYKTPFETATLGPSGHSPSDSDVLIFI